MYQQYTPLLIKIMAFEDELNMKIFKDIEDLDD